LTEVVGIRVHHNFREDRNETFKKFTYKLIIILFFFYSCLKLHAFLFVSAHGIRVLDEIAQVTIMPFMDIFPICALLSTSTTDTASTFITRHTLLSIEWRVVAQVFTQVVWLMWIAHLSFLRYPAHAWTLSVLTQIIRRVFIITLMWSYSWGQLCWPIDILSVPDEHLLCDTSRLCSETNLFPVAWCRPRISGIISCVVNFIFKQIIVNCILNICTYWSKRILRIFFPFFNKLFVRTIASGFFEISLM